MGGGPLRGSRLASRREGGVRRAAGAGGPATYPSVAKRANSGRSVFGIHLSSNNGCESASSLTWSAMPASLVSSPWLSRVSATRFATWRNSSAESPRVVRAGVPVRIPEPTVEGWGSNGMPFLLQTMPTRSSAEAWQTSRAELACALRGYWMRVRQYGHTFQSAFSGRWQVGQTFLTCVLQMGHTMKSRSMGVPHLGQMP